VNQIPHFS